MAQGRQADTHALAEAKPGRFHYSIGPYSDPVLHVKPGDRVVVDTRDAFEGAVKTEQDLPDMGPGSITYLPVRTPGRPAVKNWRCGWKPSSATTAGTPA